MKLLLSLILFFQIMSQDVINNYQGGTFNMSVEHLYNFGQLFGINTLQLSSYNKSVDNVFLVPSRMSHINKPAISMQIPAEAPYPIERFFSLNDEFHSAQNDILKDFQTDPDTYTLGNLKTNESIALRIPDIAIYFPVNQINTSFYVTSQSLVRFQSEVSNSNTQLDFNHFDSDPNENFQFTSELESQSDIELRTDVYSFGTVFKVSDDITIAASFNLVRNSIEAFSRNNMIGAQITKQFEGNDISTVYSGNDRLGLNYAVDELSAKPQYAFYFTYSPKKDTLNLYKTNTDIEIIVKTPVEVNLGSVHLGTRTLPNFYENDKINSDLFYFDDPTMTRQIRYFADDLRIFYPGIISLAFRFPYNNHSLAMQLGFPLGKYGMTFNDKTVDIWTDRDINDQELNAKNEESEFQPYYLNPKFGFAFSYGYYWPSLNNLSLNLNTMVYIVEPHYGQTLDEGQLNPDRVILPIASLNATVNIIEKLALSLNLTFPETTILKTNLVYTFN